MATINEITKLLDEIIKRYRPGGEFGKPEEALLKRAKTKSLAETGQALVSAGLGGTTVGAGAGRKWEEEVGMPSRLQLEDIRSQRLSGAMSAKAGYLEREQQSFRQFMERKRMENQATAQATAQREREGASSDYMSKLFGENRNQPFFGNVGRSTPTNGTHGGDTGAFNIMGQRDTGEITGPHTVEGYGPMFGDFGKVPSTATDVPQMDERQRQIAAIKSKATGRGISYQEAIKQRQAHWKETGGFGGW